MERIRQEILWYEQNAARKDDDLIKANLKLINNLYREVESSEDRIFLDKIIDTFCEIMAIQRDVIREAMAELEENALYCAAPHQQKYIAISAFPAVFETDWQLQEAFGAYCAAAGKGGSSYTINDYCSRIRNVWRSFYNEYIAGDLPGEIRINEEEIDPATPLINAYNNADEIHCYISMKLAEDKGNRNWANARAAFNKMEKFKQSL